VTLKKEIISSQNYELDTDVSVTTLLSELSNMIESANTKVPSYANTSLIMLNWYIGRRINQNILLEERAEYGEKIIKHLSKEIILPYGNGFHHRSLLRIVQFAKIYDNEHIVATLSRLLSWSKFIELIAIEDPLKCEFYIKRSSR
jgi:hypothetical protein